MGVLLACLSVEHVSAVLTKVKVIEGIKVTKVLKLQRTVSCHGVSFGKHHVGLTQDSFHKEFRLFGWGCIRKNIQKS